ncbi:MAG TPA: T9SS type A sorting domain-containing protein [Candidatus Acidoferrales bacterium]|nr:T9SS type A sorting domain-containing protein [Candidatus Acidoferrales bacterium]
MVFAGFRHLSVTPTLATRPNPFNPATTIRFDLKSDAKVTVEIYNLLGMKVRTLDNGIMSVGTHAIPVDMSGMASGVYYYKFIAVDNSGNSFVQIHRMLLIK